MLGAHPEQANLVGIKAREEISRRHLADIPRF